MNCGERGIVYTTGGTGNGLQCDFPFEYNGKMYYTCTYDDSDRPWCSTTSQYKGYWGYCLGKNNFINLFCYKVPITHF